MTYGKGIYIMMQIMQVIEIFLITFENMMLYKHLFQEYLQNWGELLLSMCPFFCLFNVCLYLI